MVNELTMENFERDVLDSRTPVLVDFYSPWCGPCQAMEPAFEETSKTYEGRVTFAKVNVLKQRELAGAIGIRATPTLVLFRGRTRPVGWEGALVGEELSRWLDEAIAEKPAA
jgi:thioredoxin